jgi:hypothetical protein
LSTANEPKLLLAVSQAARATVPHNAANVTNWRGLIIPRLLPTLDLRARPDARPIQARLSDQHRFMQ